MSEFMIVSHIPLEIGEVREDRIVKTTDDEVGIISYKVVRESCYDDYLLWCENNKHKLPLDDSWLKIMKYFYIVETIEGRDGKITIELSPKEAEILIGAIASHTPADKGHEMTLVVLYNRIKRKYEEFLREEK